jgi:nicotinate phosphoribosyltransferase
VGTEMATSSDAPALDIAYKLTEYAGTPRMKLSAGKPSLPGRKQVFRELRNGVAVRDVIAVRDEELPGDPLLHPVMLAGRRIEGGAFSLANIRDFARRAMEKLPADLKTLASPTIPYEVAISAELSELERRTRKRLQACPFGLRS